MIGALRRLAVRGAGIWAAGRGMRLRLSAGGFARNPHDRRAQAKKKRIIVTKVTGRAGLSCMQAVIGTMQRIAVHSAGI